MSRGLVFGNSGRVGSMAVTGMSGEVMAGNATGSAARAQHPHVTQAGGQLLSLLPAGSLAVQGSALTRLTKPEALNVSTATMTARANRRTTNKCSTQAGERRDYPACLTTAAVARTKGVEALLPPNLASRLVIAERNELGVPQVIFTGPLQELESEPRGPALATDSLSSSLRSGPHPIGRSSLPEDLRTDNL